MKKPKLSPAELHELSRSMMPKEIKRLRDHTELELAGICIALRRHMDDLAEKYPDIFPFMMLINAMLMEELYLRLMPDRDSALKALNDTRTH